MDKAENDLQVIAKEIGSSLRRIDRSIIILGTIFTLVLIANVLY